MPCRSASGYPSGTPVRGPPARGPPGGPRGEISGPPARGPPGRPGRPRGPVWGPQYGHPKWALSGPFLMGFYNQMGGPGGTPLGVHFGPRGPGGPGGPKSAHFFGYLITLPVGTVFGLFFPPGDRGQIRGIPARTAHMGVSGAPPPPVIGLSPGPCPHHAQHARHGPVRLGSMAATGPASASSALVGGT